MANASVFSTATRDEPVFEIESLRKPLALNIDVLSGAHNGVSQRVEGSEITIGSASGSDVILFADPIAPRHASISTRSNFGSSVIIRAIDGPVILDSGAMLEPGQWAEGQMPLDLSLGGTHVTLSRTINPHEFAKPLIAMAMALGLILIGPNLVDTAFSSVTRAVESPVVGNIVTNATSPAADEADATDMVALLRERVRSDELGHLIEVLPGRDGTVLASGEIGRESTGKWRSILRWFDTVPDAPNLVNAVRVGKAPEMPSIASVWLLGEPEVTLSSGEKLRTGDRARGGWTVKDISATGVVLSRNGSDVTLTF